MFSETTITRFSLLCGNEHFYKSVAFTGSVYMLGLLAGSLVCGWCSDRCRNNPCLY